MTPPKDGPRDWDKELADIDKLIASSPAPAQVPAKAGQPARPSAKAGAAAAPAAPLGRRERLTSWMWLSLAMLLGVGLGFFWPYDRSCGLPLYGYLASIGAFGVASLWSTMWSWRTRAVVVHFVSIALMFGAAFLGAREVLPRIGYAKRSALFECPAPPAPSAAPAAPIGSARLDSVPSAAAPPAAPGVTLPGAPAPTAAPAPAPAPAGQTKAPKPGGN